MTTERQPAQILPSAIDILRCVREVTRDLIAPTLAGHSERSAAATIDHMLRYAELMIAHQGQALFDEEAKLKVVLPAVADWLADRDTALAEAIRADCARQSDPSTYPSLTIMEDRVALLRQHVCDALVALHGAGETLGPSGKSAHETLRDYIRWQITREGEIVEPAFLGHGPRR